MLFSTCTVRIAGSPLHTITKKLVSVPEIRVLKQIHGPDSVLDIRPLYRYDPTSHDPKGRPGVAVPDGDPCGEWSDERERERLAAEYEGAGGPLDETGGLIAKLFGAFGALPKRLADIGIDHKAEARRMREEADRMAAAIEAMPDDLPEEDEIAEFEEEFDADEDKGAVEAETAAPAAEAPKRKPGRPSAADKAARAAEAFG